MAFGNLPAYQGGNALNFAPVTNALSDVAQTNQQYARMAQQQQSIDLEKQRTASELQTQGLQRQGLQQQQQAEAQKLHGGVAQAILNAPPDQQAAMGQRYIAAHPELQQHIAANGFDPADVKGWATSLRDEALGPQNPLDTQIKQANLAQTQQATEAGKNVIVPMGASVLHNGQMVPGSGDTNDLVKLNADAVEAGRQDPNMTGMSRSIRPQLNAELERRNVNVMDLKLQADRAHKDMLSLNSSQMLNYHGQFDSFLNTSQYIRDLADQMKQSGIPAMNAVRLGAYIQTQGNSPLGQLATKYQTAVQGLTTEAAQLEQGGYAPHEAAWDLAKRQIQASYGDRQMDASLGTLERLVRYRRDAIFGQAPSLAPGAPNIYGNAPQQPGQQPQGGPPPQGAPPQGAAPGGPQPAAGPPPGDYVYDPATKTVKPK